MVVPKVSFWIRFIKWCNFWYFQRSGTIPDVKDLLLMKANGFEIPLATSLNKFGGSSCAFLRRSFLKHLQISDGVTERNENFGVDRIGTFFCLFHTKSFLGWRIWSSVVAILEKNWPNPLVMVSLFDISSSFTLNVVLVSFDFCLVGNIPFSVLQNEVAFLVLSSSRFLL